MLHLVYLWKKLQRGNEKALFGCHSQARRSQGSSRS